MAEARGRRLLGDGRAMMVGVVLLVVAAGSGVAAGAALVPTAPPAAISASGGPVDVPVRTVAYDGASPASLTVTPGEAGALSSQAAGRITSTRCTVGGDLSSGTSLLSVNDRPLLLLATNRPLWRDLGVGDSGDDVRALQEELRRLGAPVTVDARFGRTTLSAARAVAEAAGIAVAEWAMLPADQVIWSPAPIVHVASCPAKLGDTIAAGDTVAELPAAISSARLAAPPADAAERPRVIRIDDASIPLEADGRVGSAESLDALASTPSFRAALQKSSDGADSAVPARATSSGSAGGEFTVDGELALVKPLEALVVPPAALYRLSGDRGCVVAEGTPRAVRILGSQLGKTFIEKPQQGSTATRVALRPGGAPPCR